ncbi:MAG: bacteriohemerythrin [Desulfopila sp.]|nr:bacteriohemerythrin [Desulfopila sp.]
MKLQWKESYSTGNEQLDEQHKEWIDFYNRLEETMRSGRQGDLSKARGEALRRMSDYVDYHFHFEEEFMRSIDYPETGRHWRMHKDFRNRLYRVFRDHSEGVVVLNSEVLDMIKNWLLNHIIEEDGKIREYLLHRK